MEKKDIIIKEDDSYFSEAFGTLFAVTTAFAKPRLDLVQKPYLLCLDMVYRVLEDPSSYKSASKFGHIPLLRDVARKVDSYFPDNPTERYNVVLETVVQVINLSKKVKDLAISMNEKLFNVRQMERFVAEGTSCEFMKYRSFVD